MEPKDVYIQNFPPYTLKGTVTDLNTLKKRISDEKYFEIKYNPERNRIGIFRKDGNTPILDDEGLTSEESSEVRKFQDKLAKILIIESMKDGNEWISK